MEDSDADDELVAGLLLPGAEAARLPADLEASDDIASATGRSSRDVLLSSGGVPHEGLHLVVRRTEQAPRGVAS